MENNIKLLEGQNDRGNPKFKLEHNFERNNRVSSGSARHSESEGREKRHVFKSMWLNRKIKALL